MVMAQAAVDQRLRVIFALASHGLLANAGSQYRRCPVVTGVVGIVYPHAHTRLISGGWQGVFSK
jgi:hypothetical protein